MPSVVFKGLRGGRPKERKVEQSDFPDEDADLGISRHSLVWDVTLVRPRKDKVRIQIKWITIHENV